MTIWLLSRKSLNENKVNMRIRYLDTEKKMDSQRYETLDSALPEAI